MSPNASKMTNYNEESKYAMEKFNGKNFHLWKFKIQMILEEKDLWDIVSGDETKPEEVDNDTARRNWEKRERKAMARICLSLHDSQLMLVKNAKSATEAWQKLEQHYERKGLASKLFLRRRLFTAQLKEGQSIEQHINHIKEIAEELESINSPVTEDDLVLVILGSLPEAYNNLITSLESRADADLSLDFVWTRLTHEETKLKEVNGSGNTAEDALFTSKMGKKYGNGENGEEKGRNGRTKRNNVKCFNCNKMGHYSRDCRSPRKKEHANPAETNDNKGHFAFATAATTRNDAGNWYLDSGASTHMTFRKDWIKDLKTTTNTTITTANNEIVMAEGVGDVHIQFGDGRSGTIRNVLFIPGFGKNLLSIGTLTQAGYTITYTGKHAEIRQNGSNELIARARLENGLYKIQSQACSEYANIAHKTASKTDLWHRRLGHIGLQRMQKLGTQIDVGKCDSLLFCKGCTIGKAKRAPFPKQSETKTTRCGELIHSDVWGPSQEPSPSGSRYYVTFTDDYSRFRFVFFIKSKNEVLQRFKEITALIKQQHGTLGTLRSDNGGEYVSNAFRNFCNTNGIQQQFTVPYTPQQNGVAERANGTLLDMGRAMLFESGLNKTLWAEAVATACYLQNRLPTSKLGNKTPFEAWFNKKPSLDHLRIFGCNAYVHVPSQKRRKLDARAERYIFVGYSSQSKGYRLWDSATKRITISRDVTFDERWNSDASVLDGSVTEAAEMMETMEFSESELDGNLDIQKEGEGKKEEGRKEEKASSESQISCDLGDDINTRTEPVGARIETLRADSVGVGSAQYDTEDEFEDASPTLEPQQYVRPQRQRRTPTEWWKAQHYANLAATDEPRSYNEAIQSEEASEWKVAMDAELKSLKDNQTWKLCKLPNGRSAIGCRWILKRKLNADGTLNKYKARLVAKGYSQKEGIDYEETFSPVVKFNSIRIIFAIAVNNNLVLHQMDVKTAFLNGNIEEDIYMKQPEGYSTGSDLVCKLQRSLYGLKQSARSWNQRINEVLLELGFQRCNGDNCIYTQGHETDSWTIIALYVDDLIIAARSPSHLTKIKRQLESIFEMQDLGELKYCLGLEVTHGRDSMHICQHRYITTMLERHRMADSKPVLTPQDPKNTLEQNADDTEHVDATEYRSAVGALIYAATGTRPDIANAVGNVSKFMEKPQKAHWDAVKRILRYLNGTRDVGLFYTKGNQELVGYSDSNYAGDLETRKSTTGYVFQMGTNTITWNSKRQQTVALSTCEAEYMALSHTVCEGIWTRKLLKELGFPQPTTTIHEDNQGCIALVKNPVQHHRTKHIDVKHHFIREQVEQGTFKVIYCPTHEMKADILTKGIAAPQFKQLRDLLNLRERKGI